MAIAFPDLVGNPSAWPKMKAAKEETRRRCVREKSFALPNAPPYLKLDTMRKLPNPSFMRVYMPSAGSWC